MCIIIIVPCQKTERGKVQVEGWDDTCARTAAHVQSRSQRARPTLVPLFIHVATTKPQSATAVETSVR